MQPQFPTYQPPTAHAPWQAQPGYSADPSGQAWAQQPAPQSHAQPHPYGASPFGAHPAHRPNGKLWALVGGGIAAVVVLVIAVLGTTGSSSGGLRHYTEEQAVAHIHATAVTSAIRLASDQGLRNGMRQFCSELSDRSVTVSGFLDDSPPQDLALVFTTAIETDCPVYSPELAAWQATH